MRITMRVCWLFVFTLFFPVILSGKRYNKSIFGKELKREEHVCIVKEEKQIVTFDFRKLSNDHVPDYIMKTTEPQALIYFQLCSPLKKQCNNQKVCSVCLKSQDKEISLGTFPPKVVFDNFQIVFKFTGDKCNKTSNYTTTVIMQCDYNAIRNNSYPEVYPYAKDQCDIYLHWKTSSACGPEHKTDCSVKDKTGYKYDLSKLTELSNNYEVAVNKSLKILLNVCHSVIFGHGVSCKQNTASCLVNHDKPNDSGIVLGEIANSPVIVKEGLLKIEYDQGDICPNLHSPNHIKTVVTFICDQNAKDPFPKYVHGSEVCNYFLEWRTPLACKEPLQNQTLTTVNQELEIVKPTEEETPTKETAIIRSIASYKVNCSLTTKDGEFDLTPLIHTKDDYVIKADSSEFHINVCAPLVSTANLSACQGSSACAIFHDENGGESKQIVNLGSPAENLIMDEKKHVILQYKGGATCPENKKDFISSNVTFICNYSANKGSAIFNTYKNCTYLFDWETKFVCDKVLGYFYDNCTISAPLRTIDLSALRKRTFNVKHEDKEYSINICGGKKLCNGSNICEGKNGYGSSVDVIFQYPKDTVKLHFTKGTNCSNGTLESDITFICNSSANVGSPKLKSRSPCHPHFEWQTSAICTSEMHDPVTSSEAKDFKKEKELTSNHGVLIAFTLIGLAIIVLIVILLRNPSRLARCYRIFSNPCSASSNDRVKYCRVNTTEEARLLLDNCDSTTVCQSDSDDDLLGV